jgi:hypothetical protein
MYNGEEEAAAVEVSGTAAAEEPAKEAPGK